MIELQARLKLKCTDALSLARSSYKNAGETLLVSGSVSASTKITPCSCAWSESKMVPVHP